MAIETPPLATGPPDRPPDEKPVRRWPWFIGLLVLGLVTTAIAFVVTEPSDDKPVESTTGSTTPGAEAAIIKAYQDASLATQHAFESLSVGPDDPRLAATMTDPLLSYVRHQLVDLHGKGIYYEPGGITNTNIHVVEQSPDRAVVRLCEHQYGYGFNAKGQRLAAPGLPGEWRAMEAIAVRDPASGVWKISSRYPNDGGRECERA